MDSKTSNDATKYQRGKIYCIRNYVNSNCYIGSTCQSLSQRMSEHRQALKKDKYDNMKIYQHMKETGLEHFYAELVEDYPCDNVYQLHRREGELIREMKPSLNQVVAGRTVAEYKVECADKFKKAKAINDKKYAEKNKDKIKEYQKNYYQKDAEKFKARAKQYAEEHREERREKDRQYYLRKKAEKQQAES